MVKDKPLESEPIESPDKSLNTSNRKTWWMVGGVIIIIIALYLLFRMGFLNFV